MALPPVLVVEDSPPTAELHRAVLERAGLPVRVCRDAAALSAALAAGPASCILLDLGLPDADGETVLARCLASHPEIPVVVVTADEDPAMAVRCIKAGAHDYLVKPAAPERLATTVRRTVEMGRLRQEQHRLGERLAERDRGHDGFAGILTADPAMEAVFRYARAVAGSDHPVLITGETGTGKELMARALHRLSGASGKLVAVNCAGIDDHMLADTLFGHVRGAFTGADRPRPGLVEQARDGTLFLDEIGDLAQPSQVKLLRLLQDGDYLPLGSDEPKRAQVRILCATHRDLAAARDSGAFRADLFYRLCTHRIHLPPLRDRRGDLALLAEDMLGRAADELGRPPAILGAAAFARLVGHAFPGNIRELAGLLQDLAARRAGAEIGPDDLDPWLGPGQAAPALAAGAAGSTSGMLRSAVHLPTLREVTDRLVAEALRRAEGNQTQAARLLGITQQALSQRLKRRRGEDESA